ASGEAEVGDGLVARRLDLEMEAIEPGRVRGLRNAVDVEVEETEARAEVVVLLVLVLRAVDVDGAVAAADERVDRVGHIRVRAAARRKNRGSDRGGEHEAPHVTAPGSADRCSTRECRRGSACSPGSSAGGGSSA